MRYVFRLGFAFALALVLMAGCSDENGDSGSGGTAGTGGMGGMPECQDPEDCDDDDECTVDTCIEGACSHLTAEDGTFCADDSGRCLAGSCWLTSCQGIENGVACFYCSAGTVGGCDYGFCIDGVCEVGLTCDVDADCNDGNECTEDACANGTCSHASVADNTECDFNGLPGFCVSGVCEDAMLCEGIECDDGNECTQDICSPANGLCDNPPVADGTRCTEGLCIAGACEPIGSVFPCTEQGIRAAIFTGGGPYTFSCDGPTTVITTSLIQIWNDVILDGEGNLAVHGSFEISRPATAELWGLTVSGGRSISGGGIYNEGSLTLKDSTVSGNSAAGGGGIFNTGTLTLIGSAVSDNLALPYMDAGAVAGGIFNTGTLTLIGSSVSGNTAASAGGIANYHGILTLINSLVSDNNGGGIDNDGGGSLLVTNSTVSDNTTPFGVGGVRNLSGTAKFLNSTLSGNVASQGTAGIYNAGLFGAMLTFTNTLVDNDCLGVIESGGHNIESPGNTCGFDNHSVTAEQLNLGPLQGNGGPTMTHALSVGSVAIDQIRAVDCVDVDGGPLTTDQRGEPRPEPSGTMCDVGAFELQP